MRVHNRKEFDDRLSDELRNTGEAADGGDALREAGAGFLAAADEALDGALSENSAAFLVQNRQAGGQ